MKKVLLIVLALVMGSIGYAQTSIKFRSADKAECVKSDYSSLKATFSFSGLEADKVQTTRGEFSEIRIEGTYPNGNVGEPQLPMFTRLIAIPTGATPVVTVGSHSETQYTLSDYGIGTISAMQAPIRKNVEPSTVEYAYNEAAYTRNSYNDDPIAMVEVLGTMRGITLGRLIVQPVRYNPVAGTVKVFNDIEVSVDFENGDAASTEEMFRNTANAAFQSVYDQIFNFDMLTGGTRDAYTDHPDMYNTPVKMLVICYSGFKNNSALNSWLQWKLQKGYYVDIYYTDETGTTASAIASFIKTKYNASVSAGNAYTYLITIGDTGQIPQYMTKNIDSSIGNCASDLGYASVNFSSSTSNYFPDMYYSRISVENTTHLTNYINKVLTYEKYEFSDGGNFLNNVILVGGWDSSWTARVAKPTINYATAYYFKSSNTTYGGFENGNIEATVSTSSTAGYAGSATGTSTTMGTGVYTSINSGVGFLNYTAHGDKQEWYQPKMTAAQVANLANGDKYFFGVGNCCLTGNFNNTTTTYSPGSSIGTNACFAETMIRVPNAGAIAYVGCSPYSYWYEDFYWAVGAHSYSQGNYPTTSASSKGVYDVMFMDNYWNSASALLYVGNLAVQQAVTNSNTNSSITDGNCNNSAHYYFQFYHTFGDGSVMPYVTKPEANTVTIPSTVTPGTTSITVNAVAGSYVAVTDNSSVIYGVAEANSSGVATVNFTNAIPTNGTLYVVVTRQQYQPYFGTISVVGGTQYTIEATANPTAGGTVTGAGTYYETVSCTLTATPNAPQYEFTNWKKGSSVVSTNASYTFTVSSSTAGSYTANFTKLTAHSITCNAANNGTISADKTTAYKGETVTLNAIGNDGYILSAWTVKDASNNTITVTNNQFTMPDSNVTVSATFTVGYKVTLASVMNGTISADPTCALSGTQINLTATPASGYQFDGWVVFRTSNVNTTVTVTNDKFTMPAYDVTVSAIFSKVTNEDVTVGSGTSTNNGGYVPTAVWYKYSLTQQIYTAAELGNAGTITAISFYYSSSTESGSRSLNIYMSHTTNSTITAWSTVTSSQLVYSGSHNFTQGWNTLTLTTPFSYNGSNNLLLTVDDNTGSYNGNYTFYTYSTSANRAIWYRSDDTNPTPTSSVSVTANSVQYNAQMKVTKVLGSNEGYLSVSPNNLSGFNAEGGSASSSQTVTVIGANLQSNVTVTMPNGYEVSTSSTGTYSTSLTLTPSSGSLRQMLYVRLTSGITAGNYNGNMTIASGTTSTTVSLSGTVTQGTGNQYTITASANPTIGGNVSGAGTYYEGGTCTLTATANAGYIFVNWTKNGTAVSTNSTYSFTVEGDAAYVANFTAETYTITVTANPTEGGSISGAGSTFLLNSTCTLVATASTGYTFVNWTKNGTVVSTNSSYSFTVTGNADYVANFSLNSYTVTAVANPAEGGEVTFAAKGRETLTYDFEDGTQGWTTLKGTSGTSSNTHNWMHNTAYVAYDSNGSQIVPECHNSSSGMMLSESYISAATSGGTATGAVTPDNYLVSPQIRLGGSITFYAAARMSNYPAEKFTVMVSQAGNSSTGNFIATDLTVTLSDNSWHEYTVDLSSYSGMGYVAIRHYDCNDQHLLYIDDITIVEGESHSEGQGTYYYGETCTVTATANDGYHFVNWTENGTTASASANYTFTVTGDCDLVANFTQETPSYTIVARANPTDAGTVTGGGTFESGQSCTLTATANTGYTFVNWTKGSTVVSTNSTYTFTVTESADYQANFSRITYTITAVANPVEGGTIEGAGVYEDQDTPHLIAHANEGYVFVNWTENGEVVYTDPHYVFTADSNRDLVANFAATTTQTQSINAGWNWYSTYIELSGAEGLSQFEQAVGSNVTTIMAQHGYVTNENGWDGTLTEFNVEQMYELYANGNINLSITGIAANPANHPISLSNNWNWIGYPCNETVGLNTALGGFTPSNNDMIKGRNAYATYVQGYGWWGSLKALTPGNGYMYKRSGGSVSFTYQTGDKFDGASEINGKTFWTPASESFVNNGNIMVTVNASDLTLSENVEIGAFVNGECRGAAQLMYVAPTDQYVAFLTVFGDNDEELSFKVYNDGETFDTDEQVTFTNNMVLGKVTEPFVLHVSTENNLVLFPNPVRRGEDVHFNLPSNISMDNTRVEIYNALGAMIRIEQGVQKLNGITTSGIYTVKVTDAQGNVYYGKLIVK